MGLRINQIISTGKSEDKKLALISETEVLLNPLLPGWDATVSEKTIMRQKQSRAQSPHLVSGWSPGKTLG